MSPALPAAAGEGESPVTASHVSETASTVLATDATPTEAATPARQTPLPAQLARSATPPAGRPEAMVAVKPARPSTSRRLVLVGLTGLVIMALASGIVWLTAHQASPRGGSPAVTTGSITESPAHQASPTGGIHAAPVGSITEFPIPTANSQPAGIAAGPGGNLWFTEEAGKIGRISPSGTITEFPVPTPNSQLQEIAAGPGGNLWFTEFGGNQIGRITSGK